MVSMVGLQIRFRPRFLNLLLFYASMHRSDNDAWHRWDAVIFGAALHEADELA